MTIEKGAQWGRPVDRADDLVIAGSDRELALLVARGEQVPISVTGGDLHTTVGSPALRSTMVRAHVDMIEVSIEGQPHRAIAHVILRRRLWRGRVVALCNTSHVGRWVVAPRAHPNDGLMDVVDVDAKMSLRDRWAARNRLPMGLHLPHPQISYTRITAGEWAFDTPVDVYVDGQPVGSARHISARVVPDAFELDF